MLMAMKGAHKIITIGTTSAVPKTYMLTRRMTSRPGGDSNTTGNSTDAGELHSGSILNPRITPTIAGRISSVQNATAGMRRLGTAGNSTSFKTAALGRTSASTSKIGMAM